MGAELSARLARRPTNCRLRFALPLVSHYSNGGRIRHLMALPPSLLAEERGLRCLCEQTISAHALMEQWEVAPTALGDRMCYAAECPGTDSSGVAWPSDYGSDEGPAGDEGRWGEGRYGQTRRRTRQMELYLVVAEMVEGVCVQEVYLKVGLTSLIRPVCMLRRCATRSLWELLVCRIYLSCNRV